MKTFFSPFTFKTCRILLFTFAIDFIGKKKKQKRIVSLFLFGVILLLKKGGGGKQRH